MDPSPHNEAVKRICAAIAAVGWCVEECFAARWLVDALRIELQRRKAAGEFRPAGVGRGRARVERPDMRGDRIAWLDEARLAPTERALCDMLGQLRHGLNRTALLGLFSLEAHYALYPVGASYRRHRDRFRDDDARVLSWILYLNDGWSAADGGALRIHLSGSKPRDVVPAAGTLACFLSDGFEHEVLPAARERWSITGWFRRHSPAGFGSADTILRGRDP